MLDRAAHDAAQHVAAVLVRGHDAVGDQERHRRGRGRRGSAARGRSSTVLRRSARPESSWPSSISGQNWSVSNTDVLALEDRRHAVQPEARVDVAASAAARAVVRRVLVVLHEHEVPELQEALVLAARQILGRAELDAAVEVELRAGAAGAGRPGLPEVLRARALDDPLARHADRPPELDRLLVGPEAERLVALEHRHPDVVRRRSRTPRARAPRRTRSRPALK